MRDKKKKDFHLPRYGCLVALAAFIACALLGYYVRPVIAWGMVPILFIWGAIGQNLAKKREILLKEGFEEAFSSFTGAKPEMKIGDSYGYPKITLHFGSEDDMNQAADEGRTKALMEHLVFMYGRYGFDINKGFHIRYPAWEDELRAALRAGPASKREWEDKQEAVRERANRGIKPEDQG